MRYKIAAQGKKLGARRLIKGSVLWIIGIEQFPPPLHFSIRFHLSDNKARNAAPKEAEGRYFNRHEPANGSDSVLTI